MLLSHGALTVKYLGAPLLLPLRCYRQNQRGTEPINKVKTNHNQLS
jgi:hypothetical protein